MDALLRGLLIGAIIGMGVGPISVWGACVRHEGYWRTLPIIIGGSAADVCLLATALVLARWAGLSFAHVETWLTTTTGLSDWWIYALGFVLGGGSVLVFTPSEERPPRVRHGMRLAVSFWWIAVQPGAMITAFYLAEWTTASDSLPVLIAGAALGATLAWHGLVEVLSHLNKVGSWAAFLMRIAGVGAIGAGLACAAIAIFWPAIPAPF